MQTNIKLNIYFLKKIILHWLDHLPGGTLSWWAHPLLIFSSKSSNQIVQPILEQETLLTNTASVLILSPALLQADWQKTTRAQSPVWSWSQPSTVSVAPKENQSHCEAFSCILLSSWTQQAGSLTSVILPTTTSPTSPLNLQTQRVFTYCKPSTFWTLASVLIFWGVSVKYLTLS